MFPIRDSIYFISIFSNFILGLFVFLKGKKEKINHIFFACILAAIGWLISLLLYYKIESPQLVLLIGRFNFAIILPLLYFLFKFALIFPREIISVPKKFNLILSWWFFIATVLTFFTPLVGKEEIITGPGQRETIYGPLLVLYALHYIVFSLLIITILFYKTRRCKEETEKIQIRYVLVGLLLALVWGFVTTIVLSLLGLFEATNYAPLATVIFAIFVTTAIFKHFLFDIKVIATELFTVLMCLLLLNNIFFFQDVSQLIFNTIVFIGAIIFGIFLIKSVLQEVRRREELRILYEEVDKLSKTKSEFISIASHQLRTPLTAIKGYISMIVEGTYGKPEEKLVRPLENVYQSNERLIRLVNDLLDLSRLEAGKIELIPQLISLEEMVLGIVNELKINAENKGLYIKLAKPETTLPKIMADPDKLRQVVLNVVDNAIKYTQSGGITVEVAKIDSWEQIKVSDTGAGMNEEELKSLFQMFSRATAGTQLHAEGAGIGLYVARQFIEMHKGKIWAESEGLGKGSKFYIQLPIGQ